MNREMLMEQLHIAEDTPPEVIVEKLFCAAIIDQGTKVASEILKNYLELRSVWKMKEDEHKANVNEFMRNYYKNCNTHGDRW